MLEGRNKRGCKPYAKADDILSLGLSIAELLGADYTVSSPDKEEALEALINLNTRVPQAFKLAIENALTGNSTLSLCDSTKVCDITKIGAKLLHILLQTKALSSIS